jgi:RNA-directed DNA polymerase
MKRTGDLFEQIADRDALRQATARALRGKRNRPDARQFVADLDANLARLETQLRAGTVEVGRFRQFVIRDPKERLISAPGFAERVLHHAIIAACEPSFEDWLIDDSFACRRGMGRDLALRRAMQFAGRHQFFLKLDIRKYFDSVPHDRLLALLARRFKDWRVLQLFERVVRSFRGDAGRGLPIGSLTSQHFANFYLGWFDRFVKQTLRVRGYVRYMDDMALWSNDRSALTAALLVGERFLSDELGLTLKPVPYLNRTAHGMDFLGMRVYRRHLTLNRRSRVRFRRRLRELEAWHATGEVREQQLQQRGTALVAFARSAGVSSWRFRRAAIESASAGGRRARTG